MSSRMTSLAVTLGHSLERLGRFGTEHVFGRGLDVG